MRSIEPHKPISQIGAKAGNISRNSFSKLAGLAHDFFGCLKLKGNRSLFVLDSEIGLNQFQKGGSSDAVFEPLINGVGNSWAWLSSSVNLAPNSRRNPNKHATVGVMNANEERKVLSFEAMLGNYADASLTIEQASYIGNVSIHSHILPLVRGFVKCLH